MNVEDQITYIVLKSLIHRSKKDLTLYQRVVKRVGRVDPSSTHIVADTLKLIDLNHNQFLNCVIHLKQKTIPQPDIKQGQGDQWVTRIGELELKRLENDYKN